ncbi:MAG: glyoxalase [Bacteroidota bacterium]
MDRENDLLGIRPHIELDKEPINVLEKFQSETLRPILKFQNPVLLMNFRQHLDKRKIPFNDLPNGKKKATVQKILMTDQKFKTYLIGIICGLFTRKEWAFYLEHQDALNKRIRDLLIQRVESQTHKI